MALPPGFSDFLTQIAQLEGFKPGMNNYGQSLDNAAKNPIAQQMFQQGVTPQQASQSWTSLVNYNTLMDPFKGVNQGGMRGDDQAWTQDMQAAVDSGKVAWDPTSNSWTATAKSGVTEPSRPAALAGTSIWDSTSGLKNPSAQGFTPGLGTFTSQSNVKQSGTDQFLGGLGNILPLLLLAPALGAVMPGLGGLVGSGAKTVGGGKPGAGDLFSLLKLFGGGP